MEQPRRRIQDDCKFERIQFNDSEHKIGHNDDIPDSLTLKSHEIRLIACNGDCGSEIAKIINDIIQSKVMYNKSYTTIQI